MPKKSKKYGFTASRNGTMPDFSYSPPAPSGGYAQGTPKAWDGVGMPNALPRPEHPTLGGTLYVSTMPARGGGKSQQFTQDAYDEAAKEGMALRIGMLRHLQDAADHGTERVAKANSVIDRRVKRRRKRVRRACAGFIDKAAAVQKARNAALAPEMNQLRRVENEIAQTQKEAMLAHAKAGVPSVQMRRAQTTASTPLSGSATDNAPQLSEEVPKPEASRPVTGEIRVWIFKAILGAILGLALGENFGLIEKAEFLEFESPSVPWMALSMAGGASLLMLASLGMNRLWKNAGCGVAEEASRLASQPASSGEVTAWRTVRYTVLPTMAPLVFCAIEASIFRTALVHSPSITDPDNIAYWLAGLPFVFPTAIYAGATGWHHGKEAFRAQQEVQNKANSSASFTQTITESADAQAAFALDDYVETLQARRQEILASIAAQSKPYENLLAVYQAALNLPTEATADEQMILSSADEDAVAAEREWRRRHDELADILESLPGMPSSVHIAVNQYRDASVLPNRASSNSAKLSFWGRIARFFAACSGAKRSNKTRW